MPRRFHHSTFVFVFGHPGTEPCEEDLRLLGVIRRLLALGATVKVVCQSHSALVDDMRALGVEVSRYRLDQLNMVRTRSRLRKYLKRYDAPVVHSTGTWGNIIVGLAARPLCVGVVMSVWCGGKERGVLGHRIARRVELGRATTADLVVAHGEKLLARLREAGIPDSRIVDYPGILDDADLIERYREFLRR